MYNFPYAYVGPRQPCHLGYMLSRLTKTCVNDIDQGMHNSLKVPITVIRNADIMGCKNCWMGQWRHQVPHATWGELIEQGEAFKDILQRIIFQARFEDAMPSKCKVICMWYERTMRTLTYVVFDGEEYPRV